MINLTNNPDSRTAAQANFEAGENVLFSSEAPIITDYYIGGRYRWPGIRQALSATVVCTAPVGAQIDFTLEIDGGLTDKVLTVAAGETQAEIDLSDLDSLAAGKYLRWKCTASPAIENTASQIHITTNIK